MQPDELQIEYPAALPVLPLKEMVVFPQSMTPLAIGQERSVRLIDDVVAGERLLALVASRDSSLDVARLGRRVRRRHGRTRPQDDQGPRRDASDPRPRARPHPARGTARHRPLPARRVQRAPRRARGDAGARGADAQRAGPVRAHHRARAVPPRGAAARRGERRRPERALPPRRLDAPHDQDGGAAGDPRRGERRAAPAHRVGDPLARARGVRARIEDPVAGRSRRWTAASASTSCASS